MTNKELEILEDLPQFPEGKRNELHIGKNDPKNGAADHWWASYGEIHLSGYYSLPALLSQLARECLRFGYATQENALLDKEAGAAK